MLSVNFMDAKGLSESDRFAAEVAYREALLAKVPDIDLLKLIYDDDNAGAEAAVDHFERGRSAWNELDSIGNTAAEVAIGYWPGEAAHFEVIFQS